MSSTAKFTQGKWFSALDGGVHATVGGYCKKISTINTIGVFASEEEKANAHLIAAAPEMYGTLETILELGKLSPHQEDIVSKLLAKARGEL